MRLWKAGFLQHAPTIRTSMLMYGATCLRNQFKPSILGKKFDPTNKQYDRSKPVYFISRSRSGQVIGQTRSAFR